MRAFGAKEPPRREKATIPAARRGSKARRGLGGGGGGGKRKRKKEKGPRFPDNPLAPRRSPTGRLTGRSRGSRRGSLQTPPFTAEGPDAPAIGCPATRSLVQPVLKQALCQVGEHM